MTHGYHDVDWVPSQAVSGQLWVPKDFRLFEVPAALGEILQWVWVSVPVGPSKDFIVPDGLVDIAFDFVNRQIILYGPSKHSYTFDTTGRNLLGYSLRRGCLAAVINCPASSMADRRVVASRIGDFEPTDEDWLSRTVLHESFCKYLLKRVGRVQSGSDYRLIKAFGELAHHSTVQSFASYVGRSQRNLQRDCLRLNGLSLKSMMRIERFQRALQGLQSGCSFLGATAIGDYYDQSHFCHEFRKIAGHSATHFLDRWRKN